MHLAQYIDTSVDFFLNSLFNRYALAYKFYGLYFKKGESMAEFKYDVLEEFGEISVSANGWKKELRLVSWNGRPEKYDIREWSPDGVKLSKGITFTKEEIINLKNILENLNL